MAHDDHDHPHHHPHHAPHAHEPRQAHAHAAPTARATPLALGEGTGKLLHFDASSGIAGDMTIAALLDLGAPFEVLEAALAALPLEGYHLHRGTKAPSGITATTFDVHVDASAQPERTWSEIDAMLADSTLAPATRTLARAIFRRLGEAEAKVHGIELSRVHFHEVGAVDAIVDVVGAAALVSHVGAKVTASPLPMGHGFVHARHGVLPVPPPAVVECLRGVPTYGVDVAAELVTPTGAAIVATIAERFVRWPTMTPRAVGWGAGQRDLADRPNVLRVVLGDDAAAAAGDEAGYVVLEANVDDITGELAAHAIESLLDAGALDAWASPVTMKKGRPALVVAALARAVDEPRVATTMLAETTSIGLRRTLVTRVERPRRTVLVATPFGDVPVKISEGPFGAPQRKPEIDACRDAAERAGVTLREVLVAATVAAALLDERG